MANATFVADSGQDQVEVQLMVVFTGDGDGTLTVSPPGKSSSPRGGEEQQGTFTVSRGTVVMLTPAPGSGSFFDGFESGGYCGTVNIFGYYESWSCVVEASDSSPNAGYPNGYIINVGPYFETCPPPGNYAYGQGGISQGADVCPGVTVTGTPSGPLRGGVSAGPAPAPAKGEGISPGALGLLNPLAQYFAGLNSGLQDAASGYWQLGAAVLQGDFVDAATLLGADGKNRAGALLTGLAQQMVTPQIRASAYQVGVDRGPSAGPICFARPWPGGQ